MRIGRPMMNTLLTVLLRLMVRCLIRLLLGNSYTMDALLLKRQVFFDTEFYEWTLLNIAI